MAILNKIRQRSVVLIVIIALALFSFVLTDVIKNGGFGTNKNKQIVGTVNGEDISQQDFAAKVEAQKAQMAQYGAAFAGSRAVNSVWEQEVRRIVLEEEFEDLGITIEKDRMNQIVAERLQGDPRFQNENGVFSEAKMKEYVATLVSTNPAMYEQWLNFESSLATNEKQNIYFNLIKAGMTATLAEGKLAYEMENNTRDIEFVQIPFSSIPDDQVEVSKSDIANYITAHADEFKTEAMRSIHFVKFEEKATLEDENAIKSSVAAFLNNRYEFNDTIEGFAVNKNPQDFINEFSDLKYDDRFLFKNELPTGVRDSLFARELGGVYGPYKDNGYFKLSRITAVEQMPDSVTASHILIPYVGLQNAETTRTKAQAKELADSLKTVLLRRPEKMTELAAEFSTDPGSKDKGGTYENVTRNQFVKPFNDFIFGGKVGDIDVVESDYGFHVIKIDDQKNLQKAIKVATVAKEIIPSQQTTNDIFKNTTKFEMTAGEDKAKFADLAKENNYSLRPVNNIKAMDENIPGEGRQRDIVRWAFEEDTKVGDIKRFQVEGGYLVAQLSKATKAGTLSADDASAKVTPLVRNEKKAELIKAKITTSDLNSIASNNGVSVQTASAINLKNPTIAGAGTEPKIVGAAFGLAEGEVTKPIVGNKGVYVVKVKKITPAKAIDNYSSYISQQTAALQGAVNVKVPQALKDAAEIEDSRTTFY